MWVQELERELSAILNPDNSMVIRQSLGFLGHYCWPRGFGVRGSMKLEIVLVSYMGEGGLWEDRLVVVEAGTAWKQAGKWYVDTDMFINDKEKFLSLCRRRAEEALL
jgi:hypothetical protein